MVKVTEIDLSNVRAYPECLSKLFNGEIFVLRHAVQAAGLMSEFTANAKACISKAAGQEIADKVYANDFVSMHRYMNGDQILRVNEYARIPLQRPSVRLTKWLLSKILDYHKPVFIDSNVIIRFFVPHKKYLEDRQILSQAQGSTKIQGPHQDTWFDHSTSGLNVWIAIGPVQSGNGLAIYPQGWDKKFTHNDRYQLWREQPLGAPFTFNLSPGDIILFHGEHLHASEINSTDETRFAVTIRFSLKRPKFVENKQWHPWFISTTFDTVFEKVHKLISLPFKQMLYFWAQNLYKKSWFRKDNHNNIESNKQAIRKLVQLEVPHDSSISVIDQQWISVQVDTERYRLSRYCPHEGADLSLGYMKDGKLFCAWHHASFDPKTGHAECPGLKNIKIKD